MKPENKAPEAPAVEIPKAVEPPVLVRHKGAGQLVVQLGESHVLIPPHVEVKMDAEAWGKIKALRDGKFAADFGISAVRAA